MTFTTEMKAKVVALVGAIMISGMVFGNLIFDFCETFSDDAVSARNEARAESNAELIAELEDLENKFEIAEPYLNN